MLKKKSLKAGRKAHTALGSWSDSCFVENGIESLSVRRQTRAIVESLAGNGFVVLNIDYRGRGKSRNRGNWLDLRLGTPEQAAESDCGYLDVKSAVDYLASQSFVDPERIGIVGTVIGARFALLGAARDSRIKSAVCLIGYVPPEAEKQILRDLRIPVLYALSRDLVAIVKEMTALYDRTREYGSRLIVLQGGTYGYGVLTINTQLDPAIVDWMKTQLGGKRSG